MWVEGYRYEVLLAGELRAKANVNDPTRPINMKVIIIIFPAEDKSAVIPRDKPTVLNADISSKITSRMRRSGSVSVSKKMPKNWNEMANANIEKAL